MGSFYVNFTAPKQESAAIAVALKSLGRKAFVAPRTDGYVVFYDELADSQDVNAITSLGAAVSKALGTPVLAALNHDDDILQLWLFENGATVDTYNSAPGHFGGDAEDKPSGGNAARLCSALSSTADPAAIETILRASSDVGDTESDDDQGDDDPFVFALDRHVALAEALGLPVDYVVLGYGYVEADTSGDEVPDRDKFIKV